MTLNRANTETQLSPVVQENGCSEKSPQGRRATGKGSSIQGSCCANLAFFQARGMRKTKLIAANITEARSMPGTVVSSLCSALTAQWALWPFL